MKARLLSRWGKAVCSHLLADFGVERRSQINTICSCVPRRLSGADFRDLREEARH